MAESLFSPLWYRYADQRPILRAHVSIQAQQYRDQIWYLLINESNKEQFRINQAAYAFVGRCNGEFTVAQIWDALLETLGNNAPTQNEIVAVLNELDYRELLRYDALPDIPILFKKNKDKQNKKRQNAINPFSFKFAKFNPSGLLKQLNWLPNLIFNPVTLVIWLIAITISLIFVNSHWSEIYAQFKNYMGVPKYLFIAWLAYPFVKAIHELGHALAVKKWGGDVSESGITLFMLTPAPYVDASAANRFRKRYQRILVSAIGIMVELFIAALCLLLYLNAEPSLLKDTAFVIMVICGFSSILFNGNPLLRFDAYYILCDSLDLPNLSTRSRQYWSNTLTRLLLGKKNMPAFELAKGEQKWLFLYAPLSITFSIILFTSIIFWLAEKSFLAAVLGGIYLAYYMLIKPLFGMANGIINSAPAGISRLNARITLGIASACVLLVLFFVPIPSTTMAQGVIWAPDESRLRIETTGFIDALPAKHGEMVKKGQIIAVLKDADLEAEKIKLNNQLYKLETDQNAAWFNDPTKAENISKQMLKTQADINRCEEKIAALTIVSQIDGKLVMPYQNDMMGTMVSKGKLLGYVMNDEPIQVRAALPAHMVNLVKEKLDHVEVKLADNQNTAFKADLLRLFPSASYNLPSAAMADRNGGDFTTDPNDKNATQAVEPIILVDLTLPNTVFKHVGARASVLFSHGKEPIAKQVYRRLQQVFLKHFNTEN